MIIKIIITILLLIFSGELLLAQCVNNVSTDPNNATNNSLPDVDLGSGAPYNYDQRYYNGFDWWTPNQYTLTNMEYNPGQPYLFMSNIQSPNLLATEYSYLKKALGNENMLPQNGWELLLSNLGYYPDNVTAHNNIDLQVVPYLVFYNRYKGTVRVFVRYGNNQAPTNSVKGVKINMRYENHQSGNLSGVFRLAEGKDKTLDQTTTVSIISTVAPTSGAANFWMSGDFQLTYDPCVCFYPTIITLDFEFFTTTDFKLKGRGIEITEDIVDANGNIVNADFLSGVDFSSTTDAENGFVIYKNMGKLADDYIADLDSFRLELTAVGIYNEEIEKKLAIIKVFKVVVNLGLTAATGDPTMVTLALKAPSLVFNDSPADSTKRKKFFTTVEKILGKKLDTYISENFKKKPNPTKPTMPTASFSEMNFEGQFTNDLPIPGPLFNTPGSFVNNDVPNNTFNVPASQDVYGYPIYNEALGQFALLNQPKINYSSFEQNAQGIDHYESIHILLDTVFNQFYNVSVPDSVLSAYGYSVNSPAPMSFVLLYGGIQGFSQNFILIDHFVETYYYHKRDYINQFELSESLNYIINPALDLSDKKISVALVFKYENLLVNQLSPNGVSMTVAKNESLFNANFESDYFEVMSDGFFKTDSVIISTPYVDIDAINNYVGSFGMSHKGIALEENTIFSNPSLAPELTEVKLKVMVEMEFETLRDDGSPNHVTQMFTYDLDIINDLITTNSPIVPVNNIQSVNYMQNPENLVFNSDIYFNGADVPNFTKTLQGGVYTYVTTAWNEIKINANLATASNCEVFFKAGVEINVYPESEISPEITLMIESTYDYSNPTPPVSASFISNFCNGLGDSPYQANRPVKRLIEIQNTLNETEEKINNTSIFQDIDFTLYPNPTNNTTSIIINDMRNDNLVINLRDVSGKELQVNVTQQNSNSYVLDVANLESGIYFVTVSTFGGSKTKRLVVQ